ncbi:hypothetical protein TREMEDRAFT_35563, partial [Tremella mesenterica DSM 1558]|uniref:uncharacterized protein n=1 Tax=Tremella mesenterica (strain ATCC 24925 / CBS 8224 / DSM 1558 / NBRC 9311 / NRRL Y-6157 / RJB 2259-6 / UBC 559-6) TaxID=578456 RepID=UPI00032D02CE
EEGKQRYKPFKEIWVMFLGLATTIFCSSLSSTIVANIQVDIGSYFHQGSLSSWLGTAFLLGLAAMTPLYGRLSQVLGRKGAMYLALGLFFIGTVLCAVAPSMSLILFARVIAGAGSGGLLTVTAIIVSDLVSTADRGLYQGGLNLLFGAGAAAGSVMGGAMADRFGWRSAFWIQIPPIIFATLLVAFKVQVPPSHVVHHKEGDGTWEKLRRIDWWGCLVLVIAISSISISSSLTTSSGYPFRHPLVSSLVGICGITTPLFIWIESRVNEPILPLGLLTKGQPSLVMGGFVLLTACNYARYYMYPVYLHVARDFDGSRTGLALLPSSVMGPLASLYAGWHMRRFAEYKKFQVVMSFLPWVQALGVVLLWRIDTGFIRLSIEMAVGASGVGAVMTSLLSTYLTLPSQYKQLTI